MDYRKTKEPTGKFKAANIRIPLFINSVDKETSVQDIAEYILCKTNVAEQLVEIKMKRQKDYKSYKVFVPRNMTEMFLDENVWPEGISFRRFINFNDKKTTR